MSRFSRYFNAGMALLGFGMLLLLIAQLGFAEVLEHLDAAGWALAGAVALGAFRILLMAVSWRCLLVHTGPKVRLRDVLIAFWVGNAINSLTPTGGLGEVLKGTMLGAKTGSERAAVSLVAFNLLETIPVHAINVLGPLACLLAPQLPQEPLIALIALGLLFSLPSWALFRLTRRDAAGRMAGGVAWLLRKRGASRDAFVERAGDLAGQLQGLWRTGRGPLQAVKSLAWIFLVRVLDLAEFVLLLWVLLPDAGPGRLTLLALAAQTASKVVSWAAMFVPGQVGVREGGGALLFKLLGLEPTVGFSLELLRRLRSLLLDVAGLALWALVVGLGAHRRKPPPEVEPGADPVVRVGVATPSQV